MAKAAFARSAPSLQRTVHDDVGMGEHRRDEDESRDKAYHNCRPEGTGRGDECLACGVTGARGRRNDGGRTEAGSLENSRGHIRIARQS